MLARNCHPHLQIDAATYLDRHCGLRHIAPLGSGTLRLGHNVKLMPRHCVKPYVKRQGNDMTNAAAMAYATEVMFFAAGSVRGCRT